MRLRTLPLTSLTVVLALAACDTTPTEPAMDTVRAEAPATNHGNGSQFTIITGPASLVGLNDGSGNYCGIDFSVQEGGKTRSDFYRFDKDGSLTIHTSDSAAPLDLLVDGVHYTGVGHATAAASIDPSGSFYEQLIVNANGKVTDDDGNTYQARCSAHGHDTATLGDVVIRVN